ncbi:MAG: hypothetical protein AAB972_00420, partial [Patescibacteria group bacterium]
MAAPTLGVGVPTAKLVGIGVGVFCGPLFTKLYARSLTLFIPVRYESAAILTTLSKVLGIIY